MKKRSIYAALICVAALVVTAIAIATPAAITDLRAPAVGRHGINLAWTAPSDGGNAATAYDLRYSTSAINDVNFSSATQIPTGSPSNPGQTDNQCIDGLSSGVTYWFAIKSYGSGNWSNISNVPAITTHTSGSDIICE
jgi:trimeric autotransporter adhesin